MNRTKCIGVCVLECRNLSGSSWVSMTKQSYFVAVVRRCLKILKSPWVDIPKWEEQCYNYRPSLCTLGRSKLCPLAGNAVEVYLTNNLLSDCVKGMDSATSSSRETRPYSRYIPGTFLHQTGRHERSNFVLGIKTKFLDRNVEDACNAQMYTVILNQRSSIDKPTPSQPNPPTALNISNVRTPHHHLPYLVLLHFPL